MTLTAQGKLLIKLQWKSRAESKEERNNGSKLNEKETQTNSRIFVESVNEAAAAAEPMQDKQKKQQIWNKMQFLRVMTYWAAKELPSRQHHLLWQILRWTRGAVANGAPWHRTSHTQP